MMKKAQGLSVNVIIVAAIALIVLVILGVVFMGRMGLFSGQTSDCEANGGKCRTACLAEERSTIGFVCPADSTTETADKCCIGVS